ncbi:extracellular solute-binding protein [Allonocardiopsis opalescens]|uniref:extracellular solute-binding protein n=1 Tax=Allonocardiopsis opalescens TaxID=1144618 RepID=UPI0011B1D2B9|nr:extracellular solute-binding protein [Allonocardiopsis opalescens]
MAAACLFALAAAGAPSLDRGDGVHLVLATGLDLSAGRDAGVYLRLIEQWDFAHPRVTVDTVQLSGNTDHQRAQLVADAQSADMPFDIVNIDNQWTAEFAEQGWVREVDPAEVGADRFLEPAWEAVCYEDAHWAVPFISDVGLLFYRADLLEEGDEPPADWAEVFDLAALMVERSDEPVHGYAGQYADYEGLVVNALELVWGAGTQPIEGGGEDCATAERVGDLSTGLQPLVEAIRDGVVHPGVLTDAEDDTRARFRSGEVVMMRNWPQAVEGLSVEQGRENTGTLAFAGWHGGFGEDPEEIEEPSFGVTELPGAALGGQSLAVTTASEHPELAAGLVAHLTSERSQRQLRDAGYAPALSGLYFDETVAEPRDHIYLGSLRGAILAAEPRPRTPYYTAFSEELRDQLHDHLSPPGPVVPSTEQFDDELNEVLRGG